MQSERCAGRPSQCPGRSAEATSLSSTRRRLFVPVKECERDRWVTFKAHERRLGEQVGDLLPDHSRVAFVPPRVAAA